MLINLAFKNVGKGYRDYGVYFFTLSFGVCIFYLFNSISVHQDVLANRTGMKEAMEWLDTALYFSSLFVAVIMGLLIVYANSYFMRKRKKELGVYMTLGMNKVRISIVYVLETSFVACLALISGLFLGIFFSQFMAFFSARIFDTNIIEYHLLISIEAIIHSLIIFGLIFVLVVFCNVFFISRYQLVDFLYGERKNRKLRFRKPLWSVVFFVVSVMMMVSAYVIVLQNGLHQFGWSLGCSTVLGGLGTLMFFYSVSGFMTLFLEKKEKWFFKDLNMFLCRQVSNNINGSFVLLSVISVVLYVTMSIFLLGYSIQNVLSTEMKETICYDMSFYESIDDGQNLDEKKVQRFLEDCPYAGKYESHHIYSEKGQTYLDFKHLPSRKVKKMQDTPMLFLKESDFNNIRKIQGLSPIHLKDGEYTLVSNDVIMKKLIQIILANGSEYQLRGTLLKSDGKSYQMNVDNADYEYLYMVLKDEQIKDAKSYLHVMNANAKNEKMRKQFEDAEDSLAKESYVKRGYSYSISRTDAVIGVVSTKVVISYVAIYLGMVLLITCGVILAVKQLSETMDNKYRYQLLRKLGVEERIIFRTMRKQISCFFAGPIIIGGMHTIILVCLANNQLHLFGYLGVGKSLLITLFFVTIIYGTYYGLAYLGGKSIIGKRY